MSNSIIQVEPCRYHFIFINDGVVTSRDIIGYKQSDKNDEFNPIVINPETFSASVHNDDNNFDALTETDELFRFDAALNELDGMPFMDVLQSIDAALRSELLERCYLLNSNYHRLDHKIKGVGDK